MSGLVLYSRPGCHLCEDMQRDLAAAGIRLPVRVVNIDTDPALRAAWGLRIPVLVQDDAVIAEGRLDADAVRDALGLR